MRKTRDFRREGCENKIYANLTRINIQKYHTKIIIISNTTFK